MVVWYLVAALAAAAAQAQIPAKPMRAVNAILQQYEDGPPIPSDQRFIPGETVFFSFQAQGYQVAPSRMTRLTYRIDAFDSDGIPLVETKSGKIETEVTDLDKDWLPNVRYSVLIPSYALPGQFRIAAWVKDEQSGQEAKTEATFTVGGRQIEKSDKLVVRDFRFLRTEEDQEPLAVATYHPGDTLWARFNITGFKTGEKNRIQVVYGISIVSPSGKVLFSKPQAAVEQEAPFYPKRYVPAAITLNVQPNTAPGEYTFVVSVRDEVGQQTCESRQKFHVE